MSCLSSIVFIAVTLFAIADCSYQSFDDTSEEQKTIFPNYHRKNLIEDLYCIMDASVKHCEICDMVKECEFKDNAKVRGIYKKCISEKCPNQGTDYCKPGQRLYTNDCVEQVNICVESKLGLFSHNWTKTEKMSISGTENCIKDLAKKYCKDKASTTSEK